MQTPQWDVVALLHSAEHSADLQEETNCAKTNRNKGLKLHIHEGEVRSEEEGVGEERGALYRGRGLFINIYR